MSELERRFFPSWRLGYRCNPFRSLTSAEWRDLAMVPEGLGVVIDSPPPLFQILGDQGAGKTSTLLALERSFQHQGWHITYEYLPPGMNQIRSDQAHIQIYLLDEAQRLSPKSLRRLFARSQPTAGTGLHLILSTHADLSMYAVARGQQMETFHLGQHSRGFTKALIEKRLTYFERPGFQGTRITAQALDLVLSTCGTNLRKLEGLLYEAFQKWDADGPIDKDHILALLETSA